MKRSGIGMAALTLVAGMVLPIGAVESRKREKEPAIAPAVVSGNRD